MAKTGLQLDKQWIEHRGDVRQFRLHLGGGVDLGITVSSAAAADWDRGGARLRRCPGGCGRAALPLRDRLRPAQR